MISGAFKFLDEFIARHRRTLLAQFQSDGAKRFDHHHGRRLTVDGDPDILTKCFQGEYIDLGFAVPGGRA
ncbi:hypothetical protein ACVDG8_034195 [Mesorhizobium sp. ORM8.1]